MGIMSTNSFTYDYSNLFCEDSNENGIKKEDVQHLSKIIDIAYERVFNQPNADTKAIFDCVNNDNVDEYINFSNNVSKNFKNFVVLGIGGSSLGSKAILNAFLPNYFNQLNNAQRNHRPKCYVIDNIDPEKISELLTSLDLEKTFFCVISKSGNTVETLAQFFTFQKKLKSIVGERWKQHFAIITGANNGILYKYASDLGLKTYQVPESLGGRFSVFSAVGLFPAAVFNIDVKALLLGAREMLTIAKTKNVWQNAPLLSAALNYLNYQRGKSMSVLVVYSEALNLIGEWYCQLWAESLGKDNIGQTPISVLGTTAQHSQFQLYLDGPNDKIFTFLGVNKFRADVELPKEINTLLSCEKIKNYLDLFELERDASVAALTLSNKPNESILIEEIDEKIFGKILMFFMLKTIFMGAMLDVNPYGQPGVERIKQQIKCLTNDKKQSKNDKIIKI